MIHSTQHYEEEKSKINSILLSCYQISDSMISEPDIITTEPEEQCLHTGITEDRNEIVYNKLLPLGKYV